MQNHWWTPDITKVRVKELSVQADVRVWWHVGRNQARLALLDAARGLHFRSFAEMALCGCAPRPDLLGVTSHVVRAGIHICGSISACRVGTSCANTKGSESAGSPTCSKSGSE